MRTNLIICLLLTTAALFAQPGTQTYPKSLSAGQKAPGTLLPNGWSITPLGDSIPMEDLVLNITATPDDKAMIALHSGYNPHGLVVINRQTNWVDQRIPLHTSWLGIAWNPPGNKLFVSGGNNKRAPAPILIFDYADGRLSEKPSGTLKEMVDAAEIYWSGLAHHPSRNLLFAANRTGGYVLAFDTESGQPQTRIQTGINPYQLVLGSQGSKLYCSNWASDSVTVIDTETLAVSATIPVGDNPNDMVPSKDGRLFVACSNDNSVAVIDTQKERVTEWIITSLYPDAPEGSTPNALALDPGQKTLYVANADNNDIAVVDISDPGESAVLGFLPAGWYPSAVAVSGDGTKLYVGNGKGEGSSANVEGPNSPIQTDPIHIPTTKSTVKGSVRVIEIEKVRNDLRQLTRQVYANTPYRDELLAKAPPPPLEPSIVPSTVGSGSPIKHVLYIIKENRTYDQVFGDLPQGDGDPRLTLFGREVTPNHHSIAENFVLLDNLYCDAEVSRDGHQWSNAAYATDFVEKSWPSDYGGMSTYDNTEAIFPASGYIWDLCARKGLTYRSYGEMAQRVSEGNTVKILARVPGLEGHMAPNYQGWGARDFDNAREFIREFDEFEANYENTDPEKRLPNFIVMVLPEDHTKGASPGEPTPQAAVASNDYGLGLIIERVTHSKYWPETAVFVIEDDAQDGPDHVDARRTVGLVISPFVRRGTVDSTFYTTSSMLRTIELLLGLPPMSQYDAAANPMYTTFGTGLNLDAYRHLEPRVDIHALNKESAWGSRASLEMDFSDFDLTPMYELNEIIWKNIKGSESSMPPPVTRFHAEAVQPVGQ